MSYSSRLSSLLSDIKTRYTIAFTRTYQELATRKRLATAPGKSLSAPQRRVFSPILPHAPEALLFLHRVFKWGSLIVSLLAHG